MIKRTVVGLGLATALLAGGCGDDGDERSGESAQQLNVVGKDYGYDVENLANAGTTEIVLTNQGNEEHHMQVLRVGDEAAAAAAAKSIAAGDLSAIGQGTLVGGPDGVSPGSSGTVTAELEAGSYVVFCQIPSASNGMPHSQLGMVATFSVADTEPVERPPTSDATITISDDGYQVPEGLGGPKSVRVVNSSSGPAEASVLKLNEGVTVDGFMEYMGGEPTGPPPFASAGGVTSLSPGNAATTTLNLTSGNYVVLSFTPDATGAPGFVRGQLTPFTIP